MSKTSKQSSSRRSSGSSDAASRRRSSSSSSSKAKSGSASRRGRAEKKKRAKPHILWRIVRVGVVLGLLAALLGAGAVAAIFWHWSRDLPELFTVDDYRPKQVSRIYDRNGNVLLELYEEKRTVVPYEEIPEAMRLAMIASEDSNFFEHKGLDYIGVMRAAWTNIQQGGFSQGASTITQQVVKNLLLTPEKELKRKVQEVLLARRLEEVLTKDEILWIYLNHVYFGHRVYGVEEASRYFFNKHAKNLNLNEAATLAGLVQSPERLSPIKHPQRALERRNYVLHRMYEEGFVTEDVYREVREQPIVVRRVEPPTLGEARHFAEHVRRQLIDEYGEQYLYSAGLEIYTTVDLSMQAEADAALQKGLREFDARHGLYRPVKKPKKAPDDLGKLKAGEIYRAEVVVVDADKELVELQLGPYRAPLELVPRSRILRDDKTVGEVFEVGQYWEVVPGEMTASGPRTFRPRPGPEGAIVTVDPYTREVMAVAGGYDYAQSSFNRGLQAVRQTGSSFKAFVYSAALEARVITPATLIDDAPKVFHVPGQKKPYSPENFDRKFLGPMTARVALAKSRNTTAVDVLERLGIERAVEYGKRIGLVNDLPAVWSLALGAPSLTAIETANAYATWASGGLYASPIFITRIQRQDGTLVAEYKAEARRVLSPEVAWLTTNMLRSVVTEGTARSHLGKWDHYVVGKTGTTNGPKDTWFIGYTAHYVTAVYVGYDDPREMGSKETGGTTSLPIWADYMKAVHKDLPKLEFEQPPGIIEARIDPGSGLLVSEGGRVEYFLPGTVPTRYHTRESDELSESDWTMREIGATWRADPDAPILDGTFDEPEIPSDGGLQGVRVLTPDASPDGLPGSRSPEDDGGSGVRGVGVEELEAPRERSRRAPALGEDDDDARSRTAPDDVRPVSNQEDADEASAEPESRKARRAPRRDRSADEDRAGEEKRRRPARIGEDGRLRSNRRDLGDLIESEGE